MKSVTDDARSLRLQAQIVQLVPALRAFARRFCRDPNDADDLVQDTLVKALSHLEQFEEGTRLKSWLFTIMRHAFCSKFITARREAPGVSKCVSDTRVFPAAQELTLFFEEVVIAYEDLPRHYRDAVESVAIRGLSYEQAAIELGCNIGTVKSRVSRARHKLTSRFGELKDDWADPFHFGRSGE